MEYLISTVEMSRRKVAFATLSASLLTGLFLSTFILHHPLSIYVYLAFAGMLLIFNLMLYPLFEFMKKSKICLSEQTLIRITPKADETYPIEKICNIKIKRTSRRTIREIYIFSNDNKNIFISALDQFEDFREHLQNSLSRDVQVSELREHIDYDHPLFYALLGLPVSFFGFWFILTLIGMDYRRMRIILIVISAYLLSIGIYFLWKKPLSKRYGERKKHSDFLFSLLMSGFGIGFLIAAIMLKG